MNEPAIVIPMIVLAFCGLIFCLTNFIRFVLTLKWESKILKRISNANSPQFFLWKKKVLIIVERMGYDVIYLYTNGLNKDYNKFYSACDAALNLIEAYHSTLYDESLP